MYCLMFFYTVLLSFKTSWTYNNFTYLSYQPDLRIHFLIWVTVISCFLLFKVVKLFKEITFFTKSDICLVSFSFISMMIGSFLPYYPDNENIISMLHIIISSSGSLSLLIIIQLLINRIMLIDFDFFRRINSLFHRLLLSIGMFIIMFGAINTIIELFFTFTVLLSLHRIENYFSIKKEA